MFRSEEEFEKIVDKLKIDIEPDPTHRRELRRQMLSAFDASGKKPIPAETPDKQPSKLRSSKINFIERIKTMKNISKIAAALILVIGIIGTITVFTPGTGGSGIAFADVIQPLFTARTVILDMLIGPEDRQVVIHDEVMGSRIRRTISNVQGTDIIIDLEQMKMLALTHTEKSAVCVELDGLGGMKNYLELLQDLVTRLQDNEEFQVQDRGLQEIEGRQYIVFVAENDNETITILVDPETVLPVRIEQKTPNMQIICDNLQFDVDLDESRFSIEVPDGYVVQESGIDFKKSSESGFIESLRIWAEIIEDGQFPDSINLEDIVKVGPKLGLGLDRANLTEQQALEVATRFGQGIVFIRFFKGQGKWHYAGKGVKLGDPDTPIFWYQPKDSQTWRVIYGDLTVDDVATEDLPELTPAEEAAASPTDRPQEFAGRQEDQWHVTASNNIVVHSYIDITKGPADTTIMPITLPYPSGALQSVTCDDQGLACSKIDDGQYELELSTKGFEFGQTKIKCVWTLPLDSLETAEYGYRIKLQPFIPVNAFKSSVILDEDCNYINARDPSQRQVSSFTWNSQRFKPDVASRTWNLPPFKTSMGFLGLDIQKQQ